MSNSLPSPASAFDPAAVRWGAEGLAPAVVQDAVDGRVLMLGWMDREALAATLATGEVHFHSRSRDRLWRKGETSGNLLHLRGITLDCDADALLVTAEPAGPTCHRGTRSCFDAEDAAGAAGATEPPVAAVAAQGFGWLEVLWATILQRADDRPAGSYTARLLASGVDAAARKVAEEAVEVVLAAKDDAAAEAGGVARDETRAALRGEAADLLFHLLVLLAERGLPPAEVLAELRARHASATPGSWQVHPAL
ncbi:MAG TPA: bifunctional phosphoribosyl-AMP cyclohydrolase/phosphoribosyl-ATP diphosphatase HisIE [Candidatus Limnocylindrales bacterium]|nr:bifunctional phosphoribosyl-AMP cyclohydrolase/phosphoribosyl-ATP diphosphatase HisIE [Candidatus Limnocylindrales bacterium]